MSQYICIYSFTLRGGPANYEALFGIEPSDVQSSSRVVSECGGSAGKALAIALENSHHARSAGYKTVQGSGRIKIKLGRGDESFPGQRRDCYSPARRNISLVVRELD